MLAEGGDVGLEMCLVRGGKGAEMEERIKVEVDRGRQGENYAKAEEVAERSNKNHVGGGRGSAPATYIC